MEARLFKKIQTKYKMKQKKESEKPAQNSGDCEH